MSRARPPRSIVLACAAFAACAVISAVHNLVSPADLQARLEDAVQPGDGRDALFTLVLAARLSLAGLLIWLVGFRASTIAKWLLVFAALGPLLGVPDAWAGLQQGNLHAIAWTVRQAIALFAAICLFLPESGNWFATKGSSAKADVATFE